MKIIYRCISMNNINKLSRIYEIKKIIKQTGYISEIINFHLEGFNRINVYYTLKKEKKKNNDKCL